MGCWTKLFSRGWVKVVISSLSVQSSSTGEVNAETPVRVYEAGDVGRNFLDRPTSRTVVEQSKGSRFQVVGSTDDGAAAAAP